MKVRHVRCYTAIVDQWARYAAIPASKAEKKLWQEFETTHKAWEATSREIVSTVAIDSPQTRHDAIDLSLGRGAEHLDSARGVLSQLETSERRLWMAASNSARLTKRSNGRKS